VDLHLISWNNYNWRTTNSICLLTYC